MKKVFISLTSFIILIFLVSCTGLNVQPDIVTTMFTHYDLASHIAGDKLTVNLLVPLGQDIHSFEATSVDMVHIENARLFLYTSNEIDTWISNPDDIGGKDTIVVNMSEAVKHDDEVSIISDEHTHSEDIHYWVDPLAALDMLDYILDFIIQIDPYNETYYIANKDAYYDEIMTTHLSILSYFDEFNHQNKTIYFAGHNAMSPFGNRYGLTIESLFSEFKPDDVLTSNERITFSNEVQSSGTHYLFIEALEQPVAALAIQETLTNQGYNLSLLELHSYHNLSQEDWDNHVTYVDLMNRNFEHIKTALGE